MFTKQIVIYGAELDKYKTLVHYLKSAKLSFYGIFKFLIGNSVGNNDSLMSYIYRTNQQTFQDYYYRSYGIGVTDLISLHI